MSSVLDTYSTIGNREDLSDKISDLFAEEVPFYSMATKVRVNATKHEWTADNLDGATKTGIVEGATISYTKPTLRTRHSNYTHIRERDWEVTHTQQKVTTAGVKNDVAREMMKAMKTLLRDFDAIFLNSAQTSVGTSATGRVARGIQSAIITNTAVGTGSGSSANIALAEAGVNSLLQDIWDAGGNPKLLFCGGYQKRVISNKFTAKTGTTFNIEASARKAIENVNEYEGSFGTLTVIPDRQHMARRITIIDPDMIKIGILRDIEQHKGAKTSSSFKGWVEAEQTLIWGNEKGCAKASFLKTTGVV